jgi:hypothetical protein
MRRLAPLILVATLVACADDDDDGGAASVVSVSVVSSATVDASTSVASSTTVISGTTAGEVAEVAEPELRAELLAMMEEDQAEQMGEATTNNYEARTARLVEILDEHGWPGFDLVGEDGSTAAWLIAQHADTYVELQERALELLRAAVADGQASPGDLAYLEDRVAVKRGEDQLYGTQITCDAGNGPPVPQTPIADEANVDERRAEAGLPPLADYLQEMQEICGTPD